MIFIISLICGIKTLTLLSIFGRIFPIDIGNHILYGMKKNLFLFIFIFSSFLSQASTIVVTNKSNAGSGSLRDAVSISSSGDTIRFADSLLNGSNDTIYLTSEISITKSLTIIGLYNHSDTLFISGSNSNRIFNINIPISPKIMVLDSICVLNGNLSTTSYGYGGAIYFEGDTIFLSNSVILNSQCRGRTYAYGGGLYVSGNAFITNCLVKGNFLFADYAASTNVNAYSSGGGIYIRDGIGVLTYCEIEKNRSASNSRSSSRSTRARSYGGGVFFGDSSYVFQTTVIKNKTQNNSYCYSTYGTGNSSSYGSGIYCTKKSQIINSIISNNESESSSYSRIYEGNSKSYGGGIFFNDTAILVNSIVSHNLLISEAETNSNRNAESTAQGAGIFSFKNLNIQGCNILSNVNTTNSDSKQGLSQSNSSGGGIYSVGSLEMKTCTVENNLNTTDAKGDYSNGRGKAFTSGAGIYCSFNLEVDSCSILSNSNNSIAVGRYVTKSAVGAGIASSGSVCEIKNTNISLNTNNSSVSGGNSVSSSVIGAGCIFDNVIMENCLISKNINNAGNYSASKYPSSKGAGIYIGYTADINKTTISGNRSESDRSYGCGLFSGSDSTFLIKNSTIVNNSIISYDNYRFGSGAYLPGSKAKIESSIVALNIGGQQQISGAISGNGFNLFGDSFVSGSISTDKLSATLDSLNLDTLKNNGGLYFTHLPGAGSIAINKGNPFDLSNAHNDIVRFGRRETGAAESRYCGNLIRIDTSICTEDSVVSSFSNTIYDTTGIYYDTLHRFPGSCDSVIQYNITLNSSKDTSIFLVECDSFLFGGIVRTINGTYVDSLTTVDGCDSIVSLTLTINHSAAIAIADTTCGIYFFGGNALFSSGTYVDTFMTSNGCDSIVTLSLTIDSNSHSHIDVTVCDSIISPTGKVWKTSGVFYDSLPSANGCDSILVYNLSVNYSSLSEIQKIVASDRKADVLYGRTVAVSGKYAVVGAYREYYDTSGTNYLRASGSAYVYERDISGEWVEMQKLVPSDRGSDDEFANSVSISGNYIIIGAAHDEDDTTKTNWLLRAGSAYIFERNSGGIWIETQKLYDTARAAEDRFGNSVSISGNYAIVGAFLEDENVSGINSLTDAGSAFVYERNSSGFWVEKQKLVASDRDAYAHFGNSVSISGNQLIIGASEEEKNASGVNLLRNAGASYIFERNAGGIWIEKQKIVNIDRAAYDGFGTSVSISGNQVVVGADNEDDDTSGMNPIFAAGSAYVFQKNKNGLWLQNQKLIAPIRNNSDAFGTSVSISGNTIVVGAHQEDENADELNTLLGSGSAYVYRKNSSNFWTLTNKLVAADRASNDRFGFSVSVSGESILVGAYTEDEDTSGLNTLNDAGSAYMFEFSFPPRFDSIRDTVCDSLTTLSGKVFSSTGIYYDTLASFDGCDSVIKYDILVNYSSDTVLYDTVCDSLISPSGKVWTTTNTYLDTLVNSSGCDSLVIFNLMVNSVTSSTQTLTVCDSLVSPSGKIWRTSNTYFDTISNSSGCDSLMTFNLTVNNTSSSTQTVTVCDSFISPSGKIWKTSNTYFDTILNANSCDSLLTFNLTVIPTVYVSLNDTSCDTYLWRANTYTTSGSYHDTSSSGFCDSIFTLNLVIYNSVSNWQSFNGCDSLLLPNGNTVYFSGTYRDTFNTENGCDSIHRYQVTMRRTKVTNLTVVNCGEFTSPNGKTWGSTGTYIDTFPLVSTGCDSLVIYDLTINDTSSSVQTLTVCDSLVSPSGKTWNTNGTYLDTIPNSSGCDSLMTFNLTVNYTNSSFQNLTVCDSLTSPSGKKWSSSGTYLDTINNSSGCDSLMTFNLTVNYTSNSTQSPTVCDSFVSPSGKVWKTTGNYLDTIINASGCDSLMNFNLTVLPTVFVTLNDTGCDNYSWRSSSYSASGTYSDTSSSGFCDTIYSLNLIIYNSVSNWQSFNGCDSLLLPNGNTVYFSGTYRDTFSTVNGCDSIHRYQVTMRRTKVTNLTVVNCGEFTSPNGKTWGS
ncbi:MAG: hypothetical protein ACPGVD_01170, partial [Flavobacteriales bacterium]